VPATEDVELRVSGLAPGEVAHFFHGTPGDGPCYAYFGGLCLGVATATYAGNGVADATGTVFLVIPLPDPGAGSHFVQAAVRRGAGGVYSIGTNLAER
jgi:phage tail protein X